MDTHVRGLGMVNNAFKLLIPLVLSVFAPHVCCSENRGPESEYDYAVWILNGLSTNPEASQEMISRVENTFLRTRDKYSDARRMLIKVASLQNDPDKQIRYAQDSVEHGNPGDNLYIARAYEKKKNYKKTQEYLEKTIASGSTYINTARVELAVLLFQGKGGPKDIYRAQKYLQDAANDNSLQGKFNLAMSYVNGPKELPKDPETAYKILSEVIKIPIQNIEKSEMEYYFEAYAQLGLIIEKGFKGYKPDPARAYSYFKKLQELGNGMGTVHCARLIISKKVPGDINSAKADLKKLADDGMPFAKFIYSSILISEGQQDEGIRLLDDSYTRNQQILPVGMLQLAIAYHYGIGVEKDEQKTLELLEKINNDPDDRWRSLFLARAYMRFLGLGVKKDIKKVNELLEKANEKSDDVYLDTYQLFPSLKSLIEEQAQKLLKEEELEKSKKKGKKKAVIEQEEPILAGESSTASTSGQEAQESFITIAEWKKIFKASDDGSFVSAIDPVLKMITIQDPQRHEELIVYAAENRFRDLSEIEYLKIATWALIRQGIKKPKKIEHAPTASQEYNHSFADMLDYAIQYAGQLVPWVKAGSADPEDQLTVDVIRKNTKTGKELSCRAEYTFGQNGVYHRLLRPLKERNQ